MTDPTSHQAGDRQRPAAVPPADGIRMGDQPIPTWWKWLFVATVLYSLIYWPYTHLGAPGRSQIERFEFALAAVQRARFAQMGDLQPDEPTLVRMMNDRGALSIGRSIFMTHCASCHGADGGGQVGPNLTDEHYKRVRQLGDLLRVVQDGAAGGAMPAWRGRLDRNEMIVVAAYAAALRGNSASNPKGPEGELIPPWPSLEELAEVESTDDQAMREEVGEDQSSGQVEQAGGESR